MYQNNESSTTGKYSQDLTLEKTQNKREKMQTPHSLDLQAKRNSKPEAITKKTLPKLQNSFKCDMCSLRFRLHDTLVIHLIHFHDVDERKAKCFGTS